MRKADEHSTLQRLTAPVSGIVQAVTVTNVGEVPEIGKPLITIVPDGEPLVVEALLLNRDAGFVRPGMRAIIKLDAYPFTRYGCAPGVCDPCVARRDGGSAEGARFSGESAAAGGHDQCGRSHCGAGSRDVSSGRGYYREPASGGLPLVASRPGCSGSWAGTMNFATRSRNLIHTFVAAALCIVTSSCSNPFNPQLKPGNFAYPAVNKYAHKFLLIDFYSKYLSHVRIISGYGADINVKGCSVWTGDGGPQAFSVNFNEQMILVKPGHGRFVVPLDRFLPGRCHWSVGSISSAPFIGYDGGYPNPILYFGTPVASIVPATAGAGAPLEFVWRCAPDGHPCYEGFYEGHPGLTSIVVPPNWPISDKAHLIIYTIYMRPGEKF